ncbi:MAG TPA: SDR family oxidoreductase [Sphingomicrobium sp.]|nr:SDR family oxidoreductase [Sphingomicrobium sp.]
MRHYAPRVVITGAADGIGRACAEALAQTGADLILCDKDAEALAELSGDLDALALNCDVSSEASVAVFAAEVAQWSPALDMLINAAGGGYERTLGMYRVSRALIPALDRGARRHVLLNIPPADRDAAKAIFPYASSHQAFERLSAALAQEARGTAVEVMIACPNSLQIVPVLPDRNAGHWLDIGCGGAGAAGGLDILVTRIAALVSKPREVELPLRRAS